MGGSVRGNLEEREEHWFLVVGLLGLLSSPEDVSEHALDCVFLFVCFTVLSMAQIIQEQMVHNEFECWKEEGHAVA
jgi:hypothetical protein